MQMRRFFHRQMERLEEDIMAMGEMVGNQLTQALAALSKRDEALAASVIDSDDEIDASFIENENHILGLIARQAPVAADLRLISAILHINMHLERMGDLCVNIAEFVGLTKNFIVSTSILEHLEEMGGQAQRMLSTSLTAFRKRDWELAKNLPRMDEPIDKLNRRIFAEVAATAGEENMLEWASRMILVSRYLERFSDHAVDIGEQLGFLLTGKIEEF